MTEAARFPASFMQEVTLGALAGAPSNLNLPIAWDLVGELRREALDRALMALQQRHEALRTSLHTGVGGVVQCVWPASEVTVADVRLAPGMSADAAVAELVERELPASFELDQAPLWRAWLIRIAADHHVLLMIVNHVVMDGWSCALVFRDLTRLYRQAVGGRPIRVRTNSQQFRHYVAWERDFPWAEDSASHSPAGQLMIPGPDGWVERGRYEGQGQALPMVAARDVLALTRVAEEAVGARLGSALWAAALVDLLAYTRDRVAVAATHANREQFEHYNTVGPIADQVVVSVPIDRKMPFTELVRLVDRTWRARLMRPVPLGLLMKRSIARAGDMSRLFDVAVNYMPHTVRAPVVIEYAGSGRMEVTWRSVSTLALRPRYCADASTAKVGYHLRGHEDGSVAGELWLNRHAVHGDVAKRLGKSLPWIVQQAAADGQCQIGDLAVAHVGRDRQ